MERNLNKLKKKYGTPKLLKFLRDLNPHLSPPQKKLNKEYMRYTRFGTHQTTQQTTQQTTPPHRTTALAASTSSLPRRVEGSPQAPAPAFASASASSSSGEDKDSPHLPPGLTRLPFPRSSAPPVEIDEIIKRYDECIDELAAITGDYFRKKGSFHETNLAKELSATFKDYQGALHLVHNTKGLHEKLHKRHRTKFGSTNFGSQQEGYFLRSRKRERSEVEAGAQVTVPQRQRKQSRKRAPAAEHVGPIFSVSDVMQFINGDRQIITKDRINLLIGLYRYHDTPARTGWRNTFGQNDITLAGGVEPERAERSLKEQCRCGLCGSYMYFLKDGLGPGGLSCTSVELEHHIPKSLAAQIYADVWNANAALLVRGAGIWNISLHRLRQYEDDFFRSIGGQHANVQHMFTYTCTLCNRVKSDFKPYEIVRQGQQRILQLNEPCFQAFENKLCEMFIEVVGRELDNWVERGQDAHEEQKVQAQRRRRAEARERRRAEAQQRRRAQARWDAESDSEREADSSAAERGPRAAPEDECGITETRICLLVWVCQIIKTFIVRSPELWGPNPRAFYNGRILLHLEQYKKLRDSLKWNDLQMWYNYVRPTSELPENPGHRLRNLAGLGGVERPGRVPLGWRALPPFPRQPFPGTNVINQYFGRPVNDRGVTIPRNVQPEDYQSIIRKYQGILEYMENRVRDLYN
tara:strand:+ start:2871 stop:4949 length:2079 start_codon:yes stop_codon:yes gene_type:complete